MKYVIIGGVAGGAGTAARLRRMDETAEIVIFEKGKYISYANCGLPYYIGEVIKERDKLLIQTAASFKSRFNTDVRINTEVTAIQPAEKKVTAKCSVTGEVYEKSYDKLVLAPGAFPVRPPLPGIDGEGIFTLRNVSDMDAIKQYVHSGGIRRAVVIGAGFVGLEMAENLHHLGLEVIIVEKVSQILPPLDFNIAAIVQQHIRAKGVRLYLDTAVSAFERQDGEVSVKLGNGDSIEADIVIMSVGVRPDTRLALAAGLETGKSGGIVVNEFLQTSDPDIYAVGDAIEFPNPFTGKPGPAYLAGPANKQGRICANNLVAGNVQKYPGSISTAIVKVFDMTVGIAGMASKNLQKEGIRNIVSTTHGGSHAGYYPGARQLTIQIAFAPVSGRLLSAQVAGYEGTDKRLDVLASIIQRNGTVYDLAEFEHAYAPPFSSAKDPVNIAGFVADNILSGRMKVIYPCDISRLEEDTLLLDVRSPAEHDRGGIPDALNIPVDELRDRLHQLPADRKIVIYCQVGLRGYLAQRILMQSGFSRVYNLSGGYRLWEIYQEACYQLQAEDCGCFQPT